jgi:hypothetical protein
MKVTGKLLKRLKGKGTMGEGEVPRSNRGDKYDESTLYAHMEMS